MKLLLSFLLIIGLAPVAKWQTDLDVAKQNAKQENKLILVNFAGSDWCGPCIRLKEEVFDTQAFVDYADKNLVLLRADFPRLKKNKLSADQVKKNEQLADVYNKDGQFPLTVLIDANGKVVKKWIGFQDQGVDKFIAEINDAVKGK